MSPTPMRDVILAVMVGLAIGLGAAFLVDYLDDNVRTETQLAGITAHPVIARIPIDPPPDRRPIALSRPHDLAVEAFRSLRTTVEFVGLDRDLRTIQVTSSGAGEGKTTTASNLAVVICRSDYRVLLVDADLHRPRIHERFAVDRGPGLSDALLGEDARELIHRVDLDDDRMLDVLTAGTPVANPSEVLGGGQMRSLVSELAEQYDFVIFDAAPVLPVADSVALSSIIDGVMVVVRANEVPRANVVETLQRLERVAAPVLGIVFNGVTVAKAGYSGYHESPAPISVEEIEELTG